MGTQRDADLRFRRASDALHRALERRERARQAYLEAQEHYAQALAVFDELLTERVEAGPAALAPDTTRRQWSVQSGQTLRRRERPL